MPVLVSGRSAPGGQCVGEPLEGRRPRVLVIAGESARGATSGAPVSSRIYAVFTFREGKITRYQEFYDEDPALKAVGLAE